MMKRFSYWLIVPCYNEAGRLCRSAFMDFRRREPDTGIIWVDDGSRDATGEICRQLAADCGGFYLRLGKNGGKAEAVRQGALWALEQPCRGIGYWDADLAAPLTEYEGLRRTFEDENALLVMGSRWRHLGNNRIRRRLFRHCIGRIFASCAALKTDMPVYDTQCGAKLMAAEAARAAFAEKFATRWFFDVEILLRLSAVYGETFAERRCFEIPLATWIDQGKSKVHLLPAFADFCRLMLLRQH